MTWSQGGRRELIRNSASCCSTYKATGWPRLPFSVNSTVPMNSMVWSLEVQTLLLEFRGRHDHFEQPRAELTDHLRLFRRDVDSSVFAGRFELFERQHHGTAGV